VNVKEKVQSGVFVLLMYSPAQAQGVILLKRENVVIIMLVTNIRVRTLLNCQRLRLQEHLPTGLQWQCRKDETVRDQTSGWSAVSSAVVWRRSAMATWWYQMADLSKRELQRLRNWWTFGEVTGKMIDCFMRPIPLALLSSKMLISPDKVNNLCITDRNCY